MSSRKRATRSKPDATLPPINLSDPDACLLQDWSMDHMDDVIEWIVQEDPSGLLFTARPYTMYGHEPLELTLSGTSLDAVRKLLPPNLLTLPHQPDDDPSLIETWF